MRQIRIFTELRLEAEAEVTLAASASRHLIQVLRLRPGDPVTLFNGNGQDYDAVLLGASHKQRCQLRVQGARLANTEAALRITLIQAIGRGDRMDWAVQKAVELGVFEIMPVLTERTEVKLSGARARKRQQRWQDIAISACEQSGRVCIPVVHAIRRLDALDPLPGSPPLFLHPDQVAQSLSSLAWTVDETHQPSIVVGPEGGLSEAECRWLAKHGAISVRLGPRILRTETAGPAVLAALQALYGDWR